MQATLEQKCANVREDAMGLWHGNLLCTPRVTEDMLAVAWLRFKAEGLVDRIFNEAPSSLSWFLEKYNQSGTHVLAYLKEDENKNLTPCGLGWFNYITQVGTPPVFTKCEVGHGCFRGVSPRDTIWFGRMALDWAFLHLGPDVVFGLTAEKNIPAVRYARRMEFELHGPIPYATLWPDEKTGVREKSAGYISVFTKERWEQRSWRNI